MSAAPVNGTGLVTPDVIFGSGNANGSFTGVNVGGIELALRGKLRYDLSGNPQNTFNYDGVRTYSFDPAQSNAPAGRSIFNFEFSINTDADGTTGLKLDDLTYLLSIDYDPTWNRSVTVDFDPINVLYADHALGDNTTPNGGGTTANIFNYTTLIGQKNVAQNSWNLGFFEPPGFDPQTQGLYTITLSAFRNKQLVADTWINVKVGNIPPVPLPAPVLMLGSALAGLGLIGWRRRRQA
ncbi:MAG: PEP-CTERM sorting domain-containing protein [Alphaproteobacteria bacterium]|nr:MAG: PEP-CTERM sorting domain-containing protein [Alphaproteobacteria bacterium]